MSTSNKDYLNELIAKAKKSWEGVNVEDYMNNLRDMDKETIRCRDLMAGDWITDEHGFPMQITTVGEDYAYATFVGLEGDPWEFNDKDDKPEPIPITPEILEKNGFHLELSSDKENVYSHFDEGDCTPIIFLSTGQEKWTLHVKNYILKKCLDFTIFHDTLYVHELQHALRLCGLNKLADNFKV